MFSRWTLKKFQATVVNDIWPEVTFFTLVATMVALVSDKTTHKLSISNALLTVLGTVLGLVISFRTSSAYERYQEGRKMWTNITVASRNLAQYIWIHVANEREGKEALKGITPLQNIIEKKTMVNLVSAFPVAVKHYLRNEAGIYYEDLYPLICFLPRYSTMPPDVQDENDMLPLWKASEDEHIHQTGEKPGLLSRHPSLSKTAPTADNSNAEKERDPNATWTNSLGRAFAKKKKFDPEAVLPSLMSERPLRPARNPPESGFFDYFPIFRFFRFVFRGFKRRVVDKSAGSRNMFGKKRRGPIVESNVPLEITLYLQSYNAWLLKHGLLQPAIATGIMNNLSSFQDTLANLDRIGNTPLPFAYQAHLRISLWLYLFLLPFQIYSAFKYLTIPATAFSSFLLLGFLEIGAEIENPFNYDENDLDLDHFCLGIQRELQEITAHISPDPDTYLFSAWNQPFAPADRRTAEAMTAGGSMHYVPVGQDASDRELGLQSVRRTLLQSWREVDAATRKA
jgi:predicted membrane chloride channel (bestrophin family)